MMYYRHESPGAAIPDSDVFRGVEEALGRIGTRDRVLVVPPDMSRFHSGAGPITERIWRHYGSRLKDVLPATGTHFAMTDEEISRMYGATPRDIFRVHRWKDDIVTLGTVPEALIEEVSEGKLRYPWPAQVNRLLVEGGHDLILSVGQVLPHEVIGMANYNKNVFIGTGGKEGIHKSHFLGAVYGMERMMGRTDTPVRKVLNYASDHFANHLPIVYVLTVVGPAPAGSLGIRGIYVGDDVDCFYAAAELSLKVNFSLVDKPLSKVVAYMDPAEYKSTWIGNKAIYRTRMAIADGGELVVLAPGVREFGEDPDIDRLIRKYGYVGTPRVLELTDSNRELQESLGAAAHLIHGSSEGRFRITYAPGHLTKREIEAVNFAYEDLESMLKRYDPSKLTDGFNTMADGEEIYFISHPASGLWAHRDRFGT